MADLNELEARLNALVPPGTVVAYAGEVAVTDGVVEVQRGWLLCNGAALSHQEHQGKYRALFDAIQSSHGNGQESDFPLPGASFNLPDLRGLFLRGVNGGRAGASGDPDHGNDQRPANHLGGNVGNRVGSVQAFATGLPQREFFTSQDGEHRHDVDPDFKIRPVEDGKADAGGGRPAPAGIPRTAITTNPAGRHGHRVTGGGDHETRPNNAYVHYLIRY